MSYIMNNAGYSTPSQSNKPQVRPSHDYCFVPDMNLVLFSCEIQMKLHNSNEHSLRNEKVS